MTERPTDVRRCLIDPVEAIQAERTASHGLDYHRFPKMRNDLSVAVTDALYRARMVLNPNYDPPDWWFRSKAILRAMREMV